MRACRRACRQDAVIHLHCRRAMLINCVAYQNGRKLGDIPIEDISEYVTRPDCFVWVALFEPTMDELDEMAEEFGLHRSPSRTRARATSGRRSRSTTTRCSPCCTRSSATTTPADATSSSSARSTSSSAPTTCLSVRHRTQKGFADVRARTEREPDLLQARRGLRVLRADGHRRRPLLPDPRRAGDELEQIEEQIFVRNAARVEHRVALRAEAEADGAEARRRPADGGDRQALRRPGAAGLRRHAGVLPRRLRPPAPDPRVDRRHPRNADHRDPGQPRHDLPVGQRGDQEARGVGGHHRRADDGRRHLRHELRAHAGAQVDVRLSAGDRA